MLSLRQMGRASVLRLGLGIRKMFFSGGGHSPELPEFKESLGNVLRHGV